MKKGDGCQRICCDQLVKVKGEHGRQAVFRNPDRVSYRVYQVDGCLLKNTCACDWVVSQAQVGDVFVELKGADIKRATDQIKATIRHWDRTGASLGRRGALVVCTRYSYPKHNTSIQRIKLSLMKDFSAPLHVYTNNREYVFTDLLSSKNAVTG